MSTRKNALSRWIITLLCAGVFGFVVQAQGTAGSDDTGQLNSDHSNVLCGTSSADMIFMRTRLTAGIRAQVLPDSSNNMRGAPDVSAAKIGEIPPLGVFEVLEGPTCTEDGYLWWQVNYNGLIGYTVEGHAGEYFLQPELPENIATNAVAELNSPQNMGTIPGRPMITFENLDSLSEVSRVYGNFSGDMVWASNFTLMVTGNTGSEGVWVYPLADMVAKPTIFASIDRLTQIQLSGLDSMRSMAIVGGDDGAIRIWNVSGDGTPLERLVLAAHTSPVSAIAISTDANTLASAGAGDADRPHALLLWDVDNGIELAALVGHQDSVTAIDFEPRGERLISASRDSSLRLWNTTEGTQIATIEYDAPVTRVDWSNDGDLIIAGYEDGTILLIDLRYFSAGRRFSAHEGAVRALAFAGHNTVIASSGADGRLILWDTSSMLQGDPLDAIMATYDTGEAQQVVFSPNSNYLAILQTNNVIRFWQPANPTE